MLSRWTGSYQECGAVTDYLTRHPRASSYQPDEWMADYRYCMGAYLPWISNHSLTARELMEIIQSLLTLYDEQKGYLRRYWGDPEDITILRTIAEGHGLSLLSHLSFSQYHYDYGTIHAHTQGERSLSTLILRIVEHNVGWYNQGGDHIDRTICRMARQARQYY